MRTFHLLTDAFTDVEHSIDQKTYTELTHLTMPYVQTINGTTRYYALCPKCHNPIQLIGVFRKRKVGAHGKHTGQDVSGIGTFDKREYDFCPYAIHAGYTWLGYKDDTEITGLEKDIVKKTELYFDRGLYFLERSIGVRFPSDVKRYMVLSYFANEGYRYRIATRDNFPMPVLEIAFRQPLTRMPVEKDSWIVQALKKHGFSFVPCQKINGCVFIQGDPVQIWFRQFERYTDDDGYSESMVCVIDHFDPYGGVDDCVDWEITHKITFDFDFLNRLTAMTNWKRDEDLMRLVDKYVSQLPWVNH